MRARPALLALVAVLALTAASALWWVERDPPGVRAEGSLGDSSATLTECVETGPLRSVDDANRFVRSVRGNGAFQGADVGADVALQDGRRLWVFGDTLRAADFAGQRFVRNSMLVIGDGCAEAVVPQDRGAVVPDRDERVGYWPMSVAREEHDGYDLVAVGTQRVRTTDAPDGAFAFESLGPSVAVFTVPAGGTPRLLAQRDLGDDDPDPARPQWGAAAVVHDGWAYLYGTARPDREGVFGFSLRVARVRPADVLDLDAWRYWDGRRWQPRADRAQVLVPAERGVSQTLSVFERDGRWYALSKRDEFLGSEVAVWQAASPSGPWDDGTAVASLPSDVDAGELRYMPLAHPDLHPEPDRVLVSYSRNDTDVGKVTADPFRYRPAFMVVRLPG